jgi:ribosomal-protein-alanine N-acetyltransferase
LTIAWPATLTSGDVTLRPIARGDAAAWREVRHRNAEWLKPWDATVPPGGDPRATSYRALVRRLHRTARQGSTMPFALEVDGRFVGQVTVSNIVRGSAQFASIGYWIDQQCAGRGIMPRAVAMAIDHCLTTAGLHRVEVCIGPRTPTRCGSSRSSGCARSGWPRGSSTSTARGATTGSMR